MNTDLRKKPDFEKKNLSWWIMPFWKKYGKHRDNKLAATEGRRTYLVSETNYHTTKIFT